MKGKFNCYFLLSSAKQIPIKKYNKDFSIFCYFGSNHTQSSCLITPQAGSHFLHPIIEQIQCPKMHFLNPFKSLITIFSVINLKKILLQTQIRILEMKVLKFSRIVHKLNFQCEKSLNIKDGFPFKTGTLISLLITKLHIA